jgi:hypothetical protein
MTSTRDLLETYMRAKGWDRSQLVAALQRAGCTASRQKVEGWQNGSKPDASIMGPLCDVLTLTPQQSAEFYASCGYVLPVSVRSLMDGVAGKVPE